MLDPQVLRNRLDEVAAALKPRGFDLDTATLERLETRRKLLQIETQDLHRRRNASAKTIGRGQVARTALTSWIQLRSTCPRDEIRYSMSRSEISAGASKARSMRPQSCRPEALQRTRFCQYFSKKALVSAESRVSSSDRSDC
jgi:hypothetical protein